MRSVKARLCLRGFKDLAVDSLATYSSAAGRWGQRVICIVAAQNRWPLISADVSNAFLRGLTFKELAEAEGKPTREVSMELPKDTIPLLQTFPGFRDFNVIVEILHLDRPAYGLNDAPRAWGLRLKRHFASHNLLPTHCDNQIYVEHDSTGKLLAICSAHVDDIKIAATEQKLAQIVKELESAFEKVKVERGTFMHCGIQHIQDMTTYNISLDQDKHIAALRCANVTLLKDLSLIHI